MSQWVVVSQLDEHVRVFGVFRDRAKAEHLRDSVNGLVENAEKKLWDEYDRQDARSRDEGDMVPVGYGRAYVYPINPPSVKRAYRFALGELAS